MPDDLNANKFKPAVLKEVLNLLALPGMFVIGDVHAERA